MPPKEDSPQGNDLPVKLAMPARRALVEAGYTNLIQLTTLSESQIKQFHGIGPNAIRQLRRALDERGLQLAGDTQQEK